MARYTIMDDYAQPRTCEKPYKGLAPAFNDGRRSRAADVRRFRNGASADQGRPVARAWRHDRAARRRRPRYSSALAGRSARRRLAIGLPAELSFRARAYRRAPE